MTISSTTSTISRLSREKADIQLKISLESKKEADASSKIAQINRGITKNTSESMLKSKLADIRRKETDIANIQKKKAELFKKQADIESKLQKAQLELSKKEEQERKKKLQVQEREQKRLADLEKRTQQEQIAQQKRLQAEIERTIELTSQYKVGQQLEQVDVYQNAEYDLFISHASEDKEEFVRPLAETLENMGVKVWYDEFTLKVGDSLRRSIDNGLVKSKYG